MRPDWLLPPPPFPRRLYLTGFMGSGKSAAAYALAFGAKEVADHAAIVARRDNQPVYLELWKAGADAVNVVCVVADDRKGFLSAVCAAFVQHKLVVQSAQIYTRERADGKKEAIDLFWVKLHGSDAAPDRLNSRSASRRVRRSS